MSTWALLLGPAAALTTGGLLWLTSFPANQGWIAWFAVSPLLFLVRLPDYRRAVPTQIISKRVTRLLKVLCWLSIYGSAMIGGLAFFLPALRWMTVAHPMMTPAWVALAAYCALYFPIAIALLRRIDRFRWPFALTLPIIWITLEYVRAHFLTGFAWLFLGHSQHDYLPVIQVVDLGGVYAVSFLIASVNGLLFDLVTRSGLIPSLPRSRFVGATVVAVIGLMAASLGYGFWRAGQTDFPDGPRVTMLQTNIPQAIKNERSTGSPAAGWIIQHTKDLTDELLRSGVATDLIVWPETTFTQDWMAVQDGLTDDDLPIGAKDEWIPSRVRLVASVAQYSRAHVLLGLNCLRFDRDLKESKFNSALLVHRQGTIGERYDKIHRVPFGEYLPMKETLPFMTAFSPYPFDYSLAPGEAMTRFVLPTANATYRFGVLICYEDSDPLLARRYARESTDGPPVDFLVNISNDGWFDGTEEHELHLAVCRFRAIEARRAVVRSVNMGISGVIDGNGRVVALPGPDWAGSKKTTAVLTATVPLDQRRSFYALAGDWLAVACAVGCLGLLLAGR